MLEKNSINKKMIIAAALFFMSVTLSAYAEYSENKARKAIIKFMKKNDLGYKLKDPVRITQDPSGVLRITDPGSFFYQYIILTPKNKDVTDPNVTRQLKIRIPKTCDKAVIVTHGWIDKGAGDWPADMANAFAGKTKPHEWMTLYFDWKNGAAVANPIDAVKYSSDVAGPRLAKAFLSLLPESQKLNHVHLVAHSAGTWAITTAAQIISDKTGAQIHLTLLDAYLPSKWDKKKLGRIKADKPAYVEHYYSKDITLDVTQTDLPAAHNVDLTKVDQLIKTHEYPYKWYGATITGKFRKKDRVMDKKIVTKYKDTEYGYKRSLQSSPENFKKSLKLKKANKAIVIQKPKKKKANILDISTWFK
ncbi:MAG: alpha/beta hydrolase [Planctomycetes bacterium]|nr:alpha/beta hydrolase [Planctomycetota bacterium]